MVIIDLLPTGHVTRGMRSKLWAFITWVTANMRLYIYIIVKDKDHL